MRFHHLNSGWTLIKACRFTLTFIKSSHVTERDKTVPATHVFRNFVWVRGCHCEPRSSHLTWRWELRFAPCWFYPEIKSHARADFQTVTSHVQMFWAVLEHRACAHYKTKLGTVPISAHYTRNVLLDRETSQSTPLSAPVLNDCT